MLKLSHSAPGWGVIIVVVQVGAVKIYVAAGKALRKKERQDETQFTTKVDGFPSSPHPNIMTFDFVPSVGKTWGSVPSLWNSLRIAFSTC